MLYQHGRSFFYHKWAQKKTSVPWRINSSSHLPITVIVTARHPSFMKMVCQSIFPLAHTNDKHTRTHFTLCLHHRSTTDQLSCWIPNRTYPINLPSHRDHRLVSSRIFLCFSKTKEISLPKTEGCFCFCQVIFVNRSMHHYIKDIWW